MRILVACEESQAVCKAFRARGHEAYSCDLQPCSGGHPEWHIQANALELLKLRWDLIVAHPPCTYLSNLGANWLFNKDHSIKDPEREEKGWKAKQFFMAFLEADCPRIAVENPVPSRYWQMPPYNQIVEPYMFGDPWRKRTCLWLRGLPPPDGYGYCGTRGAVGGMLQQQENRISQKRAQKFKSQKQNVSRNCRCYGWAMGMKGRDSMNTKKPCYCLRCGVELANPGPDQRYCPDCLPEVRGWRGAGTPAETRPRRRAVKEREGEFLRLVRIADWAGLSYGKFMAKSPEVQAALIAAYDRHK